MSIRSSYSLFAFFLLFLAVCSKPDRVCTPGATQKCHCAQENQIAVGVQVCNTEGSLWQNCKCVKHHNDEEKTTPNREKNVDTTLPQEGHNESPSPSEIMDASHEVVVTPEAERISEPQNPEKPPREVPKETTPDKVFTDNTQRFKIDLWQWGADAAISMTLDESLEAPYKILMPEVERRGWLMSFYINTDEPNYRKTWPLIKKAYQNGHEVSSHTHFHPDLTKINDKKIHEELKRAISELQKNLDWKMPLESFAYPYEKTDARVMKIVGLYHRYARGGDQGAPVPPNPVPLNDAYKPNWLNLAAKAPTKAYPVAKWNTWVDAAVKQKKWLIEEYHGVYIEKSQGMGKDGWEPRSLKEFKAHFDHIEKYGKKIWVAPVRIVGHYIDERQTATFKINKWSSKEVEIVLADKFSKHHTVPLTYVFTTPGDWKWKNIKVLQNGKQQQVQVLSPGIFRIASVPEPLHPIRITPH